MKEFNSGYIYAPSDNENGYVICELLVKSGYKFSYIDGRIDVSGYLIILEDGSIDEGVLTEAEVKKDYQGYRQFYINNGKLSWDEPEEIAPPLQGKDYDDYINSMEDMNELEILGEENERFSEICDNNNSNNNCDTANAHTLQIKD